VAKPIEFYFDFSSPYAYLASEKIEAIATKYGRTVAYKPILLGAILKTLGGAPLSEIPLKGPYSKLDMERSARYLGVKLALPTPFPIATLTAARGLLWLQSQGSAKAVSWVHKVFCAYFVDGKNVSEPQVLAELASEMGIDAAALAAGCQEQPIKDRLKALTDEALARGVFGAPFVFIDDEPFWGADRLPQIERTLERGPI
jgi:2-hydroxychromene-2-carboxylate isomerase